MSKEKFNMSENAQDAEKIEKDVDVLKYNYQRYLELGGIINEKDYKSAIDRMDDIHMLDRNNPSVKASISQVKSIASRTGIEIGDSKETIDSKIILYVLLRLDTKPEDVEHHHGQMSDQQIFGEVLRILGDTESLDKLIKFYPNISFEYREDK